MKRGCYDHEVKRKKEELCYQRKSARKRATALTAGGSGRRELIEKAEVSR